MPISVYARCMSLIQSVSQLELGSGRVSASRMILAGLHYAHVQNHRVTEVECWTQRLFQGSGVARHEWNKDNFNVFADV